MIKFILGTLKTDKQLVTNFVSLGLVQVTNFVLPLIVYPHIFKIVGAKHFGSIVFALNIVLYLSTVIDYGYSVSAPKDIALKKSTKYIDVTISNIIQVKLLLFIFCASALLVGIYVFDQRRSDAQLYLFSLIMLLGNTILPTWLFQGMENMKHLTWINLLSKLVCIALIFSYVNTPDSYFFVIGLIGSANLLSGIIGIIYAYSHFGLKFNFISITSFFAELKQNWYYFISGFSAVLFSNSTIIVLGFFVSNSSLGNYGIAEKIAFSLWQIITVFSQVTFPVMSRLNAESVNKLKHFIKRYHVPFIILISILSTLMLITSDYIVYLFTGDFNREISTLLKILSLFPIIVAFNVPANQVIIINEKQKYNAYIFNIFGIISIISCILTSRSYGVIGAAYAAVVTQIFVTVSLYVVLKLKVSNVYLWK